MCDSCSTEQIASVIYVSDDIKRLDSNPTLFVSLEPLKSKNNEEVCRDMGEKVACLTDWKCLCWV